jgi:hypothetical protein
MCNEFLSQIISSPKIWVIIWKDAVTEGGGGWVSESEVEQIAKAELPIMYTVGFVLHESQDYICVSDSIGESETGSITKIPKGMVVSCVSLPWEKESDDLYLNNE